jgi:hypothetical protein
MGMSLCAGILGVAAASLQSPSTDEIVQRAPDRRCSKGTENKVFGKTEWVVFGCDDNSTLVFVTAPGNPAAPFYFTVFPVGSEYHVFGEGTGNKNATEAAFEEIQQLSSSEISSLIADTKLAAAR